MIKPLFMNVNLDAEIVFAASRGVGVEHFFEVCKRMKISAKEAAARYEILKVRPEAYRNKGMRRVTELEQESVLCDE